MADRVHSLTVVLEADQRIDDAEPLIAAIKHLRGVLDVRPVVADVMSLMAEERAKRELGQKLWEVLYPSRKEPDGNR